MIVNDEVTLCADHFTGELSVQPMIYRPLILL